MGKKLTIICLSSILVMMTMCLCLVIYDLYDFNKMVDLQKDLFQLTNENFRTDKRVLEITEECNLLAQDSSSKYFNNKIECANNLIDFRYDNERDIKFILNPLDMSKDSGKGVCRDYAIFMKSVLDNMYISSEFVYEPKDNPNHIYVTAYYKGEIYRLENGMLMKYE